MAYPAYLASFDDVAIGLAPLCEAAPFARGKSFGKVLAYLDRKVPVLGSAAGEHPAFFTPATGVISNDEADWVRACGRLLADPARRQRQADAAFEAFRQHLGVSVAGQKLADILASQARMRRVS